MKAVNAQRSIEVVIDIGMALVQIAVCRRVAELFIAAAGSPVLLIEALVEQSHLSALQPTRHR